MEKRQGYCYYLYYNFSDQDHEHGGRFNLPFRKLVTQRRNLAKLGNSQRHAIHVTQETIQVVILLQTAGLGHKRIP